MTVFIAYMNYGIEEASRCIMATILMIDDDRPILELVKNGLEKDGHTVTIHTSTAQVPLEGLNGYDLIILDIMMPDMDGFTYCGKIRSLVDCPILFLTAKTMERDITSGLGLGADDYLTKPFRIAELRARVHAHLRREQRERHVSLTFDRIKIDLSAKELLVDNIPVPLTKSEYLICEYLAGNRGQVFSKKQIYEAVFSLLWVWRWFYNFDAYKKHKVEVRGGRCSTNRNGLGDRL